MKKALYILIIMAIMPMSIVSPAMSGTDRKILSGTVCQPREPHDHMNLRYRPGGLEALKDVEVVCPITRDSTENDIKFVDVRYQRGSSIPVPGQPNNQFKGKFKGKFVAASNLAAGNAESETADAESSATGDPTSVHIETGHLPSTENHFYTYTAVIPKGAILKSITYVEETR